MQATLEAPSHITHQRPWRSTGPWGRFAHNSSCHSNRRVQNRGQLDHWQHTHQKARQLAASQTDDAPPAEMQGGVDDLTATKAMGMGSWRLKGSMDPPFEGLTAQVEGLWRHMLDRDLKLYPMDKKYKYLDSLDPERTAGMWGYTDIQPPEKGDPRWPRMQIENRCYQSSVFRKLHIELAHRQDGLQVIHCVMYPRTEYDLPILSFDMVGNNGRVSLVCIDPCPVAADRSLPPIYVSLVRQLQQQYHLENNRAVPSWGKEIFSDLCIIIRPSASEELANFVKYTIALTQAHLQLSKQTSQVQSNKSSRLAEIKAGHKRYAVQHLKNSSTRGVLAAAFTPAVADEYMTNVMFDTPQE
ncbi:hypothetical protein WJX82_006256 [Trebouxia sp. C0006]